MARRPPLDLTSTTFHMWSADLYPVMLQFNGPDGTELHKVEITAPGVFVPPDIPAEAGPITVRVEWSGGKHVDVLGPFEKDK